MIDGISLEEYLARLYGAREVKKGVTVIDTDENRERDKKRVLKSIRETMSTD